MTVTADNKKRIVLPSASPGDVFDVQFSGGSVVLTKMEPVKRKAKLVRDKETGLLVIQTGRPVSWRETRAAIDKYVL